MDGPLKPSSQSLPTHPARMPGGPDRRKVNFLHMWVVCLYSTQNHRPHIFRYLNWLISFFYRLTQIICVRQRKSKRMFLSSLTFDRHPFSSYHHPHVSTYANTCVHTHTHTHTHAHRGMSNSLQIYTHTSAQICLFPDIDTYTHTHTHTYTHTRMEKRLFCLLI